MKRSLYLLLLFILISCTGEQKGIETTTPEPLEEISVAMDGGSVGKYMLSVGKEGKGVLQRLDDAGNVVAEEAVTVLVTNSQFDFTALGVRVTGTVDADGKIISITITDIKTGSSVTASISYPEQKAAVEPQAADEKKTGTTETPDSGGDAVEYPKWNMVTAHDMHTCAIKDGKTVWCWGMNSSGQLGFATETPTQTTPKQVPGISDAVFIHTGTSRTCVITGAKEVWCWGGGSYASKKIDDLKGVTGLSFVGDDIYGTVTTATASLGTKVSLASLPYAKTDLPPNLSFKKIAAITSGFYFLEDDGDVKYWDAGGVVTQKKSGAVDIAAYDGDGVTGNACAVDNTGLAACWGPTAMNNVSSAASVALGGKKRCIIENDNSLWCHPFNESPKKVDIASVKSVTLGMDHICAIDSTGYLYCWGNNASGQLGDGTTTSHDTPVKVK